MYHTDVTDEGSGDFSWIPPLYRTTWHYEDELSEDVRAAVAELPGGKAAAGRPLTKYVEGHVLPSIGESSRDSFVAFNYAGYDVLVRSSGVIVVSNGGG